MPQFASPQRLFTASLILSASSILFLSLVEFDFVPNYDDLDPEGYGYMTAILFGIVGGVMSVSRYAIDRIKRFPVTALSNLALTVGIISFAANSFIIWLFWVWAMSCGEGPCY